MWSADEESRVIIIVTGGGGGGSWTDLGVLRVCVEGTV